MSQGPESRGHGPSRAGARQQGAGRRRGAAEPNHVGDGGAVLAGAARDFFVAEAHFAVETVERLGSFDRIQILALDVLDEGDLEEAFVGVVLNDRREFG